jgi:isopentenyl diphosphate isomerase/L-lactate dehydrogenase-like FMN-dependent dehydrogenase
MRHFSRRLALQRLIGMYGAVNVLGAQQSSRPQTLPPIDDPLLEPVKVMDFAPIAKRKLDPIAWDYLEGGAEDEVSLRDNREGFNKIIIRPKVLTGIGKIDMSLELLGLKLDYPILLDPTGGKNCFHPNGEFVVAEAAARSKAVYVSGGGFDDLIKAGKAPVHFQLTTSLASGAFMKGLARRAEDRGSKGIVFTIDIFYYPHKDRNFRNNFQRSWCELPGGVPARDALGRPPRPANPERLIVGQIPDRVPIPTWDTVNELVSMTKLPVIIKGILTKEATQQAVTAGAAAVIVSNHGGRQLDHSGGTIEALPEVVEGAAGKIPVLIDGGIRRGTDIIKCLALGAKAVLIGRPYLYGLTAFGGPGVERVLQILQSELANNMGLAGVGSLKEIDRSLVRFR